MPRVVCTSHGVRREIPRGFWFSFFLEIGFTAAAAIRRKMPAQKIPRRIDVADIVRSRRLAVTASVSKNRYLTGTRRLL